MSASGNGTRRSPARTARRAVWLAAQAVRSGRARADDAFDRFLLPELREVSDRYWTPLPVVRRVASWLRDAEVRTVVDIGSGAGKFCIAGALLTRCRFIGLEQRASLVASARGLAEIFRVDDRVTFVNGRCGATTTPKGNAYYFFNPFGPYSFSSERFADPDVASTQETYRADIAAATEFLSRAPRGTSVITYNGFGGRMPSTYERIDIDTSLPGALAWWRKHRMANDG